MRAAGLPDIPIVHKGPPVGLGKSLEIPWVSRLCTPNLLYWMRSKGYSAVRSCTSLCSSTVVALEHSGDQDSPAYRSNGVVPRLDNNCQYESMKFEEPCTPAPTSSKTSIFASFSQLS